MNIHFISGLPRSGSTLLAAILRQNPRIRAGMTGPLASIYQSMLASLSRNNEVAMFVDEEQRQRLIRGLFDAYYADEKREIIFDTSRAWCAHVGGIAELFPDAKIICCVRNFSWVLDSIERIVRRNPFELSGIFGFDPTLTVFHRVNAVASNGMAGWALDALKEACYGPHSSKLLLIDYDALAKNPKRVIRKLYEFIGEPEFIHDFEHVNYEAREFDTALGTPGLHSVSGPVRKIERKTILPPQLFARFEHDDFWRERGFHCATILP